MSIAFDIERPPTGNHAFQSAGRRRVLSPKHKAWREAVLLTLPRDVRAALKAVDGPFLIAIKAPRPDWRARDCDNLVKPILDCLTKGGDLLPDDARCKAQASFWAGFEKNARHVRVFVAHGPDAERDWIAFLGENLPV